MKKLISLFLALTMVGTLVACSGKDKLEGTYRGSYIYDGNEFYAELTLNEDGTYKMVDEKNGQPHTTYEGDYELMDNGKLRVYRSADHSTWNMYDYVDGHLEDDNAIYKK